MHDLKALGCTVGTMRELDPYQLHSRYVKLAESTPSRPYVPGVPTISFGANATTVMGVAEFCCAAFDDAGHAIAGRIGSEGDSDTITVKIDDAFWKDGLLRYDIPAEGSGFSERREIVYHDLDAIWSWVTSDQGRKDMRQRADALRDQISIAMTGRPHLSLKNVLPIGISTGQAAFIITWEVSCYALDPALSRKTYAFPIKECLGIWEGEDLEELLKKQDRRLSTKARTAGDRFLVDQVAAPFIRETIRLMGVDAFMDMMGDPDGTMPKGTMPRHLMKKRYGIDLPAGMNRITLKHGIMSAKIRLAATATWDDGVLKYDGRVPASIEMTIKGTPGAMIIDHPVLKKKIVSGYREQEGHKIITFADILIPYKQAFRRTGLPDAY